MRQKTWGERLRNFTLSKRQFEIESVSLFVVEPHLLTQLHVEALSI